VKAGSKVKEFRKLNDMTQQQLADHIAEHTGLKVSVSSVANWERDKTHTPNKVLSYMDTGEVEAGQAPPDAGPLPNMDDQPPLGPDDLSGPQEGAQRPSGGGVKPLSITSQAYEKACIDLWQMIGFGVQVAGRGIGSPVVYQDGVIIQAQAGDLGKAYGKLAEQNETFRRLIIGMTQGGVWVEVVGVTVQLGMAIAQNHAAYATAVRQADADNAAANGNAQEQQAA
jgi:DNA-binding XRE family transcriptional regulator